MNRIIDRYHFGILLNINSFLLFLFKFALPITILLDVTMEYMVDLNVVD